MDLFFIFYFYRGIEMVSSIVEFQWYWHRLLNFWYRDIPSTNGTSGIAEKAIESWH